MPVRKLECRPRSDGGNAIPARDVVSPIRMRIPRWAARGDRGHPREQCGCCSDGVQALAKKRDLAVLGNEIRHEQMVGEPTRRRDCGVNGVLGEDLVWGVDANDDVVEVDLELGVELKDGADEALDALGAFEAAGQSQRPEERHLEDAVLGEQRRRLLSITEVAKVLLE
jgi:hypothetical protein